MKAFKITGLFIIIQLIGSPTLRAQSNFPSSWIGSYEGTMYLENPGGILDSLDLSFDLLENGKNRWTYRMTFDSPKWGKQVKDYELVWNDSLKSPSIFLMDEKNGLLLREYFMNHQFYSHYQVEGKHFMSSLQRRGNDLYFEIRCTDPKMAYSSISDADDQGKRFEVQNFHLFMLQYATLKVKKPISK
ncbi:MAG: hypothetical protein EP338_06740 [Bacteroidetes bacterium]|nr:MAG: hypothetical protein EP338_06740 [Bacteroidota bacterium]